MSKIQKISNVSDQVNGLENILNVEEVNYGIFRAKVVDNKDEEMTTGRIKVWIPALHYPKIKEEDEDGVWAWPCTPFAASNLEKEGEPVSDFGSLYVPPKDSFVFVFFEDGDVNKVRYFGGVVLEGAIPTENQGGEEPWNKHTVIKTLDKRIIFVSDDTKSDASIIIRGKDRSEDGK